MPLQIPQRFQPQIQSALEKAVNSNDMDFLNRLQGGGIAGEMSYDAQMSMPGTLPYAQQARGNYTPTSLTAMSGIPIASDVAGLKMDYEMFRDEPESRTPLNFGLSALGALPIFPPLAGLGTMIGVGAKNFPHGKLKIAEKMEAGGAGRDEIFQQTQGKTHTGLYRGAENKWRTEIDDSKSKFSVMPLDMMGEPGSTYMFGGLGDALKHDELYKGYPDMENMNIATYMAKSKDGTRGQYNPASGGRSERIAMWGGGSPSTLAHEGQHAVSDREGFAMGGSPDSMRPDDLVNPDFDRWLFNPDAQRIRKLTEGNGQYVKELTDSNWLWKNKYEPKIKSGEDTLDATIELLRAQGIERGSKKWTDAVNAEQIATDKVFTDFNKEKAKRFPALAEVEAIEKRAGKGLARPDPMLNKYEGYRRLADEVQARNVQKRLDMPMWQRQMIPPWMTEDVPLQDQIVRMGSGGVSEARAWHGSPHRWDKPDLSKIGTGEGAQAYGHGFYSAESQAVGQEYKDALGSKGLSAVDTPYLVDGEKVFPADVDYQQNYQAMMPGMDNFRDDRLKFLTEQAELSSNQSKQYKKMAIDSTNAEDIAHFNNMSDIFDSGYKKNNDLANDLQGMLSRGATVEPAGGHLYKLDIDDSVVDRMLDWDAPLSEQSKEIQNLIDSGDIQGAVRPKGVSVVDNNGDYFLQSPSGLAMPNQYPDLAKATAEATRINDKMYPMPKLIGEDIHDQLVESYRKAGALNPQEMASKELASLGIPGIKYWDGSSRLGGKGTRNFVNFNADDITAISRNGEPIRRNDLFK